jgi:hypothetical protein
MLEIKNDDDSWDFGFCAVDETELQPVEKFEERLDLLYRAILPLLQRLKENSEKDYIFWPNRKAAIEEFEEKLRQIYEN